MKLKTILKETPLAFLIIFIGIGLFLFLLTKSQEEYSKKIVINVEENLPETSSEDDYQFQVDYYSELESSNHRDLIISMQKGNIDALDQLKVIAKEEKNNDIYLAISSHYLKLEDRGKAIEFLSMIKSDDREIIARKELREAVITNDISKYYSSLEVLPNSYMGNYNLGTALLREQKYGEAVKYLDHAANLSGGVRKSNALANSGIAYSNLSNSEVALSKYIEAINLNPSSVRVRLNLAALYRKMDNTKGMLETYLEVLKLKKEPTAYIAISNYYWGEGLIKKGLNYLEEGLSNNPNNTRIIEELSSRYLELGELSKAKVLLVKVINQRDDSSSIRFNIGKIYSDERDISSAIESYKRALEISENTHFESANNLALLMKDLERWDEAEKYHILSTQINREYSTGYFNLGLLYYTQGEYKKAINTYLKGIEYDQEDYKSWFNLGLSYSKIGDNLSAISSYRESIRLNPSYSKARLNLGILLNSEGQKDEAIKQYIAVNKIQDNWKAWYNLALLYSENDSKKSIDALEKSLELGGDSLQIYRRLSRESLKLEDYKAAENYIKLAIDLDPTNDELYNNLAKIYELDKNYSKAIITMEGVVRLNGNTKNYRKLGDLFYKSKMFKKAVNLYLTALEVEENSDIRYDLGKAYYRLDDFTSAITQFSLVEKSKKNDPWLFYNLGKSYLKLGNPVLATNNFSKAIELSPSFKDKVANISSGSEESVEVLKELLVNDPGNRELKEIYITELYSNHMDDLFIDELNSYMESDDISPKLSSIAGRFFFENEDYSKAREFYTLSLKANPEEFRDIENIFFTYENDNRSEELINIISGLDHNPGFNSMIGDYFYKNKEYELATSYYIKAYSRDESEEIAYNLGKAYYRNKEFDKAQNIFNSLNNNSKWTKTWLARSYNKLNRSDEAIKIYNSLLVEYPEFIQPYIALGDISLERNRVDSARSYYEKALKIEPDHKSTRNKLESIN